MQKWIKKNNKATNQNANTEQHEHEKHSESVHSNLNVHKLIHHNDKQACLKFISPFLAFDMEIYESWVILNDIGIKLH